MPKTLLVDDNERLDRPDVEFLAETPASFGRALGAQALTDPVGLGMWIFSGFAITNPSAAVIRVSRGCALLRQKRNGVIEPGVLLGNEGASQLSTDISTFADGTYSIWIRAEGSDSETQNRIFWNPVVPEEEGRSLPTRRAQSWGLRIQAVTPGSEWMKIGEVVVAAGVVSSFKKLRSFYFEGAERDGSFDLPGIASRVATAAATANTLYDAWGAGNDRNSDRAANGVRDFATFGAALRSQMADIIGDKWYASVVEPLDQKVSRNGDLTLSGSYFIDGALELTSDLTAPIIIGSYARLDSSVSSTSNPTGAEAPALVLKQTGTANNRHAPPLLFAFAGADSGVDGAGIWAKRVAEDDVDLYIGKYADDGAVSAVFIFDTSAETFATTALSSVTVAAVTSVTTQRVLPSGLSKGIGDSSDNTKWWTEIAAANLYGLNDSSHPSTDLGVVNRNQRNNVVARCKFIPSATPTVDSDDVFNVAGVARNGGVGKYRVTLDHSVSLKSSVSISIDIGGVPSANDQMVLTHSWASATHLDIFILYGNPTVFSDPAEVTVTVVGQPGTLVTG